MSHWWKSFCSWLIILQSNLMFYLCVYISSLYLSHPEICSNNHFHIHSFFWKGGIFCCFLALYQGQKGNIRDSACGLSFSLLKVSVELFHTYIKWLSDKCAALLLPHKMEWLQLLIFTPGINIWGCLDNSIQFIVRFEFIKRLPKYVIHTHFVPD